MFSGGRAVHVSKGLLLALLLLSLLATILVLGALFYLAPPTSTAIVVIWVLIVPLSYQVLAEGGGVYSGGHDLPGVPAGSAWQPSPSRPRPRQDLPARERALRDLRHALKRLGYSQTPAKDPAADLLVQSPEGKSLVIKVVEGQAGILACQDAMKAMIGSGAKEAILLAPEGSTSTARRFVRKIRSRKGFRIRIWNSADEGMRR